MYALFSKKGVLVYALFSKQGVSVQNVVKDIFCFSYYKKVSFVLFFFSVCVFLTDSKTFFRRFGIFCNFCGDDVNVDRLHLT